MKKFMVSLIAGLALSTAALADGAIIPTTTFTFGNGTVQRLLVTVVEDGSFGTDTIIAPLMMKNLPVFTKFGTEDYEVSACILNSDDECVGRTATCRVLSPQTVIAQQIPAAIGKLVLYCAK